MEKKKQTKENKPKTFDGYIRIGNIEVKTHLTTPLTDTIEIAAIIKHILEDAVLEEYLRDIRVQEKVNGGSYIG